MPTSFAADIVPLFTERDIGCMGRHGVPLTTFSYMADAAGDDSFADHAHARHVFARLYGSETPRMPMGSPYWTDAMLNTFQDWMAGGFSP